MRLEPFAGGRVAFAPPCFRRRFEFMRRLKDIFGPLIAILLILQVSAACALPAEVHLNLCIGFDGHIDISIDGCAGNPNQPPRQPDMILYGENHHDECLDVAIGCASSNELCPLVAEVCSSKAKPQRNNSPPTSENYPLSFSHRISKSSIRTAHLNTGAFPPPHLVSLRTIVLLI